MELLEMKKMSIYALATPLCTGSMGAVVAVFGTKETTHSIAQNEAR
jgi:hypothetical protein